MDALTTARFALEARAKDPKVKMIGLSDDLLKIAAALGELQVRAGVLSVAVLSRHYGQSSLPAPLIESLAHMSQHAAAVHRAGTHGKDCTCEQCCMYRLVR